MESSSSSSGSRWFCSLLMTAQPSERIGHERTRTQETGTRYRWRRFTGIWCTMLVLCCIYCHLVSEQWMCRYLRLYRTEISLYIHSALHGNGKVLWSVRENYEVRVRVVCTGIRAIYEQMSGPFSFKIKPTASAFQHVTQSRYHTPIIVLCN